MIRVIDESGDDYLYPNRLLVTIDLPEQLGETLFAE